MIKCSCYDTYKELKGWKDAYTPIYGATIGICHGTFDNEHCVCGGDKLKCDFYPEVKLKAKEKDLINELKKYKNKYEEIKRIVVEERDKFPIDLDVQKLSEDDIIVGKFSTNDISMEQLTSIYECITNKFPDNAVLLLPKEIDIQIYDKNKLKQLLEIICKFIKESIENNES